MSGRTKRMSCWGIIEARSRVAQARKGGQWKKVVVDVKVTSMDRMNDEFKKKNDKYSEWTT